VFTAALNRIEQVPFFKLNAGDTANEWSAALPNALAWMWQQLAPPDLRVLFPVHTQANGVTKLYVPPIKHRYTQCKVPALPCGPFPSGKPGATSSPGKDQPAAVEPGQRVAVAVKPQT
jgi:hypothetical protein